MCIRIINTVRRGDNELPDWRGEQKLLLFGFCVRFLTEDYLRRLCVDASARSHLALTWMWVYSGYVNIQDTTVSGPLPDSKPAFTLQQTNCTILALGSDNSRCMLMPSVTGPKWEPLLQRGPPTSLRDISFCFYLPTIEYAAILLPWSLQGCLPARLPDV